MKTPAELFSLDGKVAVVIGGTGELCSSIAGAFAKAGAKVILAGRDAEKAARRIAQIAADGGHSEFLHCDATSRAGLEKLLEQTLAKFGHVDVLLNGAGINSATPFLEIPEAELDRILAVNFKGVFLSCQVFGKYMVERGSGSIINIGSISGLTPLSRVFSYSASKAAVHNLSKNLAREWASRGVRVNILVPGFFPAEQNRKVLTPDRVASILAKTPMARFGQPNELAGAVLLLASDAGGFVTGIEMVVDGGYDAMSI
jgi:NAD(P)-dependent dehydrogenase (short-subunit alcohol dehydrogenase family)